jgi:hypothetical protein
MKWCYFAPIVAAMTVTSVSVLGQPLASVEGRWFGALKTEQGDRHCWLSDRRSNGTYTTHFLTEDAGMFERYTEGGRWAQSPTAFATFVETKNGSAIPARRLEYEILELTPDRLVYRHVPSGTRFSTRRVGEDFQLPEQCGIR